MRYRHGIWRFLLQLEVRPDSWPIKSLLGVRYLFLTTRTSKCQQAPHTSTLNLYLRSDLIHQQSCAIQQHVCSQISPGESYAWLRNQPHGPIRSDSRKHGSPLSLSRRALGLTRARLRAKHYRRTRRPSHRPRVTLPYHFVLERTIDTEEDSIETTRSTAPVPFAYDNNPAAFPDPHKSTLQAKPHRSVSARPRVVSRHLPTIRRFIRD